MKCSKKTKLTGEYWRTQSPIQYSLDYFSFSPDAKENGSSLSATFSTDNPDKIIEKILELKRDYVCSNLGIRKSLSNRVEVKLYDYQLFDFYFFLANRIEGLFKEFGCQSSSSAAHDAGSDWGRFEYHRAEIESDPVFLSETGLRWTTGKFGYEDGRECARIRLEGHHIQKLNKEILFSELIALVDRCDIQYLAAKNYSNNYSFLLGNGRQGVDDSPISCSDIQTFKEGVYSWSEKHKLVLGLDFGGDKSSSSYNARSELEKSPTIVMKDVRTI